MQEASEWHRCAAAQPALALRSASRGGWRSALPFVAVPSIATALLPIGWRSALAALSPKVQHNCWQTPILDVR
jgi:hypothetical protein